MESVFFHSFLGPRSWDKPDLALRAAPESLGTPVFCPRRHAESGSWRWSLGGTSTGSSEQGCLGAWPGNLCTSRTLCLIPRACPGCLSVSLFQSLRKTDQDNFSLVRRIRGEICVSNKLDSSWGENSLRLTIHKGQGPDMTQHEVVFFSLLPEKSNGSPARCSLTRRW